MKISGIVYMLITNTFILWNPHWPLQQPQSEARLSCKQGWRPPCQFWPLQPRSWHWGRQGCYEFVSLLTSLSNSLHMKYSKGFQSSELGGQISLGQWSFRLAYRQPGWFWLCGRGSVRAGTRMDILRQQSPSRASSGCQGPLCTAWCWPPLSHLKEVGEHDVALSWDDLMQRTMPETENFVLLSGRSDISLLSILVLVQNFLQMANQGPVHF